jgi:hypothetical protein
MSHAFLTEVWMAAWNSLWSPASNSVLTLLLFWSLVLHTSDSVALAAPLKGLHADAAVADGL